MFWNNSTGIKSTTANVYIEMQNRTNLHVLTRAHVRCILLERTAANNTVNAYGVSFDSNGTEYTVVFANKEVILSAGIPLKTILIKY